MLISEWPLLVYACIMEHSHYGTLSVDFSVQLWT